MKILIVVSFLVQILVCQRLLAESSSMGLSGISFAGGDTELFLGEAFDAASSQDDSSELSREESGSSGYEDSNLTPKLESAGWGPLLPLPEDGVVEQNEFGNKSNTGKASGGADSFPSTAGEFEAQFNLDSSGDSSMSEKKSELLSRKPLIERKILGESDRLSLFERSAGEIFNSRTQSDVGTAERPFDIEPLDKTSQLYSGQKKSAFKEYQIWNEEEGVEKSDATQMPFGWSLGPAQELENQKRSSWWD